MSADLQAAIDQVQWYHEFDFGGGLKARSRIPGVKPHRRLWKFIERQLDRIDFHGKTVLDIGCWDGYWSFHAERRGAKSVYATDDRSQNWSDGNGLLLAKQLLNSRIETNQNLSIYELGSLHRAFDIIMCFGVYYHLHDPLYALAQVRHCCHSKSIVLFEGDVGIRLKKTEVRYLLSGERGDPVFLPSPQVMEDFLTAAYFQVRSRSYLDSCWKLKALARSLAGKRNPSCTRGFFVCEAFEGVNPLHIYRPPFGLEAYDERFRTKRLSA